MATFSLILGLLGGVFAVIGIFTAVGVLPTFIQAEEAIGPVWGTTAFFWGLSALMLLGSIAISVSQRSSPFDQY
jgi:hypothetical protein